jgi:hypothetical protein
MGKRRLARMVQIALDGVPAPRPKLNPELPRQSERDFMAAVIELATLRGWRHWHDRATNAPRQCWHCGRGAVVPRNDPGWPDLVLVRRPRIVWAELKRDGEEPTVEQAAWLAELQACGQEAYVWKPADWPEIMAALK